MHIDQKVDHHLCFHANLEQAGLIQPLTDLEAVYNLEHRGLIQPLADLETVAFPMRGPTGV